MTQKNHSFLSKSKEILIEILIIVFAVSISISLHNRSEHKHQQTEVVAFLEDLKVDLQNDTTSLYEEINGLKNSIQSLTAMNESILSNTTDSGFDNTIWITSRKTNNGNYDGFKSSGKIGYIENKKVKKLILKYYHDNLPTLSSMENIYNTNTQDLIDYCLENEMNNTLKQKEVKNKILLKIQLSIAYSNALIRLYSNSDLLAKEIISEIEKQLK